MQRDIDPAALHEMLEARLLQLSSERANLVKHQAEMLGTRQLEANNKDLQGCQLELDSLQAENSELKLETLRMRKKVSIVRLKLASKEEDVRMLHDNAHAMTVQLESLLKEKAQLKAQLATLKQQLEGSAATQQAGQEDLCKQREELALAKQEIGTLHAKMNDLKLRMAASVADGDTLRKQLAGTQMAAAAARSQADELAASLSAADAAARGMKDTITQLQAALAEARSEAAIAREDAREAHSKARVAEEGRRVVEQSLHEWQQVADERRRMMQDHEQQLVKVSEERIKLSSDRASAAEEKLTVQVSQLQSQLERETSKRQDMELSLRQQLLSAQGKQQDLQNQLLHVERKMSDKDARIQELEQMAKIRELETPNRMVNHAVKNVDRLVSQLLPVAEDEEEEEEEQDRNQGRGTAPLVSTAQGITDRAQAYLSRVQQHQQPSLALAPAPAAKATAAPAPKPAPKQQVQATQPTQPVDVPPAANKPATSKAGALKKGLSNTRDVVGSELGEEADDKPAAKAKAGGRKQQPKEIKQRKSKGMVDSEEDEESSDEESEDVSASDKDVDYQPVKAGSKRPANEAPAPRARRARATGTAGSQATSVPDDVPVLVATQQSQALPAAKDLPCAGPSSQPLQPTQVLSHSGGSQQQAAHKQPPAQQPRNSQQQEDMEDVDMVPQTQQEGDDEDENMDQENAGSRPDVISTRPLPTVAGMVGPGSSQLAAVPGSVFKLRVSENPLAALNPRVMQAAGVQRQGVPPSAKEMLRAMNSKVGDKASAATGKRKLTLGSLGGAQKGPGDVLPAHMLFPTGAGLSVPKVRKL